MNIEREYDIGPIIEVPADIDCELDWDNGEPIVAIHEVTVGGLSMLRSTDKLMQNIGLRIADMAENDDSILDELMSADGVHYTGGIGNPAGKYVVAS